MILLDKVTKRFGPKILFENVSMQFDPGKRYGLTGANGAGKSTLLKMLGGSEETDTGSIEIPSSLRLGILKQNHFEYDQYRIIDTVLMGNKTLWDAMSEKERLLAGDVTDEVGLRLGELEGVIAEENGYMAESEAGALLEGLGIPADKHVEKMTTLPAGYKLRVLIAQVLFGKSDVLLLDEPTNHLDLDSIRWLEHFLTEEFKGLLVCVSHDRHFLNVVATHIADVDYKTITIYTGGYDDFIAQKYENRQRAEQQSQAAKKKIGELQDFVSRFGAHKSKSNQAQSRLKQIEKLEEQIEQRGPKRSSLIRPFIRFEFDKPSGRDVLRVVGLKKTFQLSKGDELTIYDGASVNINRGDKIAITGPNGIGKSTLMKLIVGGFSGLDADTKKETLVADAGDIQWGHDVSVGYFAQDHHESLGSSVGEMNAFEWLYQFDKNAAQEHIRGIMGRLLFSGDAALKRVAALSGGELARLLLCKLLLQKHNVLVLDEPTNHLDIESIEGLLDGLRLFNGTVVVTSHDRHFVSEVATRVLELHKSGDHTEITDFGGTYEEFLEKSARQ